MIIVDPSDLGNRRFEVQEGRVRFLAARKAVFVVGSFDASYQICLIVFSKKDGSILVSTPYFGTGSGIVTNASLRSGPPYTISLREGGKITSHLVKLSHHPDGRVHFSQDGKVRTEIIRQSFPLDRSLGEVFQLHVYNPAAFEALDLMKEEMDRAYLRNVFRGALPSAITVTAEWRRKVDIQANTYPPNGIVQPITPVKHRRTKEEKIVTLLGEPSGWPMRDHVLVLSCRPTTSLANLQEKAMILLAGWDPHEIASVNETVRQTGCLVWMYPIDNADELATQIGSIDIGSPHGIANGSGG